MTLRPTSIGFVSLALVLAACGDDGNADGSAGSESDTSADATMTDPSNTSPSEASQSMTEPTTDPDTSAETPTTDPDTTTAGTTNDPDTGSTGDSTTGDPSCPYTPVDGTPDLALQLVAGGFNRPVFVLGHPDQPDQLYVVEQGGDIRILEPGEDTAPDDVFLHVDVSGANNITVGDERGLLGFAFHPDFPDDPRVYVAYNAAGGGAPPLTVSEFFLMRGDDSQVDPASERIVIEVGDAAGNHNGGMIGFGADGYLYIGTGDGGGGGDSYNTGRNTSVILAKMLRIDPEPDGMDDTPVACIGECSEPGPFDYTIPADNPFVDDGDFAPEIWAWGFRNPWRWSWDLDTGDLWMGDVGQGAWEEISIVAAGLDYGWSDMEGNHCYGGAPCDTSAAPNTANEDGMIAPIIDYQHSASRCSVTGGTVYRSCEVPGWDGVYTYGDYCSGEFFALTWDGTDVQGGSVWLDLSGEVITGHGWNAWGDSYFTTVEGFPGGVFSDGFVYRLAPE
jgi:glucose/arabinose dehydrogenase